MYKILEDNSNKNDAGLTILEYYSKKYSKYGWEARTIRGEEYNYYRSHAIVRFTISQINAHKANETIIREWGVSMDDEIIPNEYKQLVNRSEIKAQLISAWCEDISERPDFVPGWKLKFEFGEGENKKEEEIIVTRDEYHHAIATIRRHNRKGPAEDTFKVSEVRRPCTVNDIFASVCVNGKVHYMGNPFIPVEVKVDFAGLFKDAYWTVSVKDVIDDQIIAMFS
jgi:hypothetical protein